MCTITLLPIPNTEKDFIITSNRDEASTRPTLPPEIYTEDGCRLIYPKDELAGGTWIGASDKMRMVCLMNGGFKMHERKSSYKKSRGVVVKDFLKSSDVLNEVESYDFEGIEPFTMIIVAWKAGLEIYELIWDGTKVHFKKIENEPYMWSASMTYTKEMKEERKKWFEEFLENNKTNKIDEEQLWNFHHKAGAGDKNNGFIIDRGELKTTSITQFTYSNEKSVMRYEDLKTNNETLKEFLI